MKILTAAFLIMTNITFINVFYQPSPPAICPDFEQAAGYSDDETWEELVEDSREDGSILTYLGPSDDSSYQLIGFNTFWTPENEDFTLEYRVFYPVHQDNLEAIHYRFILLVNEEIVQINRVENKSYFDMELKPGDLGSFSVPFATFPPGIYNIVLAIVENPDAYPEHYTDISGINKRTTVIVGNEVTLASATRPYVELPLTGHASDSVPKVNLFLGLRGDFMQWNYPEASLPLDTGVELPFQFYAGYPFLSRPGQADKARFAARLFLNYEPLLLPPFENGVLYAEVTSENAYSRIDLQLPPVIEPGRYDLLALRIDNPEVPYCLLTSDERNEVLAIDVTTLKVVIDVIE